MQRHKLSVLLGFVFLLAAVARADTVTSDYDHTADFSKYKTFMWIREPEPKEAFMTERIIASVNAQLVAKGMRQLNDGADLAVGANMATQEKHTWETYYTGGNWGWGPGWGSGWGPGWATTAVGANRATQEYIPWETYYAGYNWGWGPSWATTEEKTYEVGTLTVDLFDAQSRKLVWQGIGTDTVSSKPEKRTRETDKQIEKMFKDVPLGTRR